MSCWSVNLFDFSLKKLHSREKSNELTEQQDMCYYIHNGYKIIATFIFVHPFAGRVTYQMFSTIVSVGMRRRKPCLPPRELRTGRHSCCIDPENSCLVGIRIFTKFVLNLIAANHICPNLLPQILNLSWCFAPNIPSWYKIIDDQSYGETRFNKICVWDEFPKMQLHPLFLHEIQVLSNFISMQ